MLTLSTDIAHLPAVGSKKAELLNAEAGIYTVDDLLHYYPYKYIDKSKVYKISEIRDASAYIQIKGTIRSFSMAGEGRNQRLTALFSDETGSVELIWFKGLNWVRKFYKPGVEYIIFGKPSVFNRKLSIAHPEIEEAKVAEQGPGSAFEAAYSATDKMRKAYLGSKELRKIQHAVFQRLSAEAIHETLPDSLIARIKVMPLARALRNIHFPENNEMLEKARFRLKFEELFFLQLDLLRKRKNRLNQFKGFVFSVVGHYFNTFYKQHLPFELTGAQKRVIREIRKDLGSGKQMNRLLQGDVGSGKTLVALMCCLLAIDNGFQACIMAPTEILAAQHFESISHLVGNLGLSIRLLTGSSKTKARRELHEALINNQIHILIGTHALLEDQVQFANLGLVIIDEQHRFGVAQRAKLWAKNVNPPHVLVMTATPIPRTLAMTFYGDLDSSVIDELPPGRKPVKTTHATDAHRLKVFDFMRKQIALGRQIYVVYPLIQESETMDYKDLEDGVEAITRAFPSPEYAVSVLHGKMKQADKERSMELFVKGITHIMVATTVIEVGVNVPNASVMVIESAERFGLSQLHQLRGRVGRGADQSFCILMTSLKLTHEARHRIQTMVESNDGFFIAEADLKLRGPGEVEGTRQSGFDMGLRLANLAQDAPVLQFARSLASEIIDNDPKLESPENQSLVQRLRQLKKDKIRWGVIS